MKKQVSLIFCILFSLLTFVSAIEFAEIGGECASSDGKNSALFGYAVDKEGTIYKDLCTSSSVLREYYCDVGVKNTLISCSAGCYDGACFSSSCDSDLLLCNQYIDAYCTGTWETSDYDSVCASVDADSGVTCEEGACDYEARAYCLGGEWHTGYYCDAAYCGDEPYAQAACYGVATSTEETSCTDAVDNDGDGSIDCNDGDCSSDSACVCSSGSTEDCSSDVGACLSGTETCVEGQWSSCSGVEPSEEICDSVDNDCDGTIDDDCLCVPGDTRDCGENIGVCKAGVQLCTDAGTWSLCYGASYGAAQVEQCNGLDDDCDGNIDEGCECTTGTNQTCGSDVGYCTAGYQLCEEAEWSECIGAIDPVTEVCNDVIDNDCDGFADTADDTCEECVSDSDCDAGYTCSDGTCIAEEETVTEEVECSVDRDCAKDEVCDDGVCIAGEREKTTVATTEEEGTTEETTTGTQNVSFFEENSTFFLIFGAIFIALLLFFVGYVFVKPKKGKKGEGQTAAYPEAKQIFQERAQERKPEQQPFLTAVEKKLEESIEKSKKLFKK